MSELVNGASRQSKRSEVERGRASEWSEQCERTNVASDRVALSKRDCHAIDGRTDGRTKPLIELRVRN